MNDHDQSIIAVCPKCGARNRVPGVRWTDRLKCGECKEPLDLQSLYPGRAVDVTDATFQREVADFKGPVLVDFFAPW
jgi:thioredoxin 2